MLTSIIFNPIRAMLYLAHLSANIALLFLLVQLILTWRRFSWLVPIGAVGEPLTAAMLTAVDRRLRRRLRGRKLSERGKLFICISILSLVDIGLAALAGAMR